MPKARLAILIGPKGRGTNLKAIALACQDGRLDAEVAVVISPVSDSPASQWAREEGLTLELVSPKAEAYGGGLLAALRANSAEWVCLAGYTRLLPTEVLNAYSGRILNIHPALLPKFGGKGMYGMHVHEAVLAAGEEESGCSVHLVTERYDEGPVVMQLRCPVEPEDTPETLAARVLELEKQAYWQAIAAAIRQAHTP